MKKVKQFFSLIMLAVILFASSLRAVAIDFVAEDIYESVFVVYSGNSLGSGFAIGKDCIVTNAHVIANPNRVVIKSYEGKEYQAFIVGINQEQDIAILGVEGVEFSYLTIADGSEVKTGDDIYAIGAPKSMAYTLTKGVISAKNRELLGNKYIQIDAAINEGNSGGPLLNDSGQVLGINTLKMSNSEGIGLAIPTETLIQYLQTLGFELDENGNVLSEMKPLYKPNENAENPEKKDQNSNHREQIFEIETVIYIITAGSIVCNVVLFVSLVYQKKKNLNLQYDPRERTDFDIDILE